MCSKMILGLPGMRNVPGKKRTSLITTVNPPNTLQYHYYINFYNLRTHIYSIDLLSM